MEINKHKIEDRELLLKAARHKCSISLGIIYGKYQPIVYDYLKRVGADGVTEDICQSVFVVIRMGKCDYDGQSPVDSYLCTVAKNILRNQRRIKADTLYPPEQIENLYESQNIEDLSDPLIASEEQLLLKKCIEELPPKSRQAIKVFLLDKGKDERVFWDHVFGNPDVFRMRLKHAIKLLRKRFLKS